MEIAARRCNSPRSVLASVRLRLPDGSTAELVAGDLVGRTRTAAVFLDDPRLSEAHAMVSLRDGALHLLALRRMFAVGGKPLSKVRLRPGLQLEFATDLVLTVEAVRLPDAVAALEHPAWGRELLSTVASLFADPPRIAHRYQPEAPVHVWCTDDVWRVQPSGGQTTDLAPGDTIDLGEHAATFVLVPLEAAAQAPTEHEGSVQTPYRIVASYDAAVVHRQGSPPLVISGVGARIITELAGFGAPVSWQVLVTEVWGSEVEPTALRHRLDVTLSRLRQRLRAAGVRVDLVHTDGAGQVSLLLYEHDSVEECA